MMTIHVLSFGPVSDLVASGPTEVPTGLNAGTLKQELQQRFPGLQQLSYSIAVNRIIAPDEQPIADNDEVALLPPFSGG
jgi:molybdopterin converting factor small subunit